MQNQFPPPVSFDDDLLLVLPRLLLPLAIFIPFSASLLLYHVASVEGFGGFQLMKNAQLNTYITYRREISK